MTQAFSRLYLTEAALFRSQASPCGTCDGHMTLRQLSLRVLRYSPQYIISQMLHIPLSLIYHRGNIV